MITITAIRLIKLIFLFLMMNIVKCFVVVPNKGYHIKASVKSPSQHVNVPMQCYQSTLHKNLNFIHPKQSPLIKLFYRFKKIVNFLYFKISYFIAIFVMLFSINVSGALGGQFSGSTMSHSSSHSQSSRSSRSSHASSYYPSYSSNYYSTSFIDPSSVIIILFFLTFFFSDNISAKFGFWATSYSKLQLAYLLSEAEINEFINSMDKITKKSAHSQSLSKSVEDITVTALRAYPSLIAANFVTKQLAENDKNKNKLLQLLRGNSIEERAKISIGKDTSASYYDRSHFTGLPVGVHKEMKRSLSYVILTIALVSIGPSFKIKPTHTLSFLWDNPLVAILKKLYRRKSNQLEVEEKDLQKSSYLTREKVKRMLLSLGPYVRSLDDLKAQQERQYVEDRPSKRSTAGYEIDILWTPDDVRQI